MIKKNLIQDIRPSGYNGNEIKCCNKSDSNLRQYKESNYHQRRGFSMKAFYVILFFLISLGFVPFMSNFVSSVYAQTVAIITKGNYQLKIFIQNSDTIEGVVNDWLAGQENIIVDQIKANNSTGNFSVIIRYHAGGLGKVSTRIKFFDTNTAVNVPKSSDETPESWTQNSISAFSAEHNIHFVDILTGSGPWDMFVVYDDGQGLAGKESFSSELIDEVLADETASVPVGLVSSDLDNNQIVDALIDGSLVSETVVETRDDTGTSSLQMAPVFQADTRVVDTVMETFFDIINVGGAEVAPTPEVSTSSPVEETIATPHVPEDANTNETIITTSF